MRARKPTPKSEWRAEWGRCTVGDKRRFPKRDIARREAHRAGHLHPYKCEICGDYHLTSQSRTLSKLYKMLKPSKGPAE